MDFKYLIVIVGLACVFETEAASSELVRERRDSGGFNVIQAFLQAEQLISSCKKTSSSPSSNETNPVVQFIETHDIQCLFDGFLKIVKDMSPPKQSSRRKRDASTMIMNFLQLQQDIEKCKKANPPTTNSTNVIEKVMNDYDVSCLATTVINFIKTLTNNGPQRTKRALQLSDITCFAFKLINDQAKIEKIVNAFKKKSAATQTNDRRKRAASMQRMCDDFGTAVDGVLQLVLDFAPNQPGQ